MSAPLRDTKSNLYEAAVAAMRDVNEVKAAARSQVRERPSSWRLILLLVGLAGALLLLLQPAWLAGPATIAPEPPAVGAASLRLSLLRERQRVFDFVRTNGRLPGSLAEAGTTRTDLRYDQVAGGAFTLTGSVGDSLITLHSGDSLTLFLGTSLQAIKNRGRP